MGRPAGPGGTSEGVTERHAVHLDGIGSDGRWSSFRLLRQSGHKHETFVQAGTASVGGWRKHQHALQACIQTALRIPGR